MRGWKKTFQEHGNQRKPGVPILISDEIDFKIKTIAGNQEEHYILMKESNKEDDTANANPYEANVVALQYIRYILTALKGETESNTKIVGNINTPLSPMD